MSGHLGGMPLAMITGRGDQALLKSVGLTPLIDERIWLIGGRDLEVGEREAIYGSHIHWTETIPQMLPLLPKQSPFWIHFDTDYIDPRDAPAMRYPSPGGSSALMTKHDLKNLRNHINMVGLSISAWAPHLDINGKTAECVWEVLSPLFAPLS